ncbi:MAG TPA: hypothetical protein VH853_05970 [Polyangia bacterium]|jgi:hypothetical protein|nr:hypothetical protein [Polyangia bacterium]
MRSERSSSAAALAPSALLASALLAGVLACSSPESFIVLALESSAPSSPIVGVAQITVVVSQGTVEMKTLTYPAGNLSIVNNSDAGAGIGTLSIGFSGTETGDIKFQITALDARGCAIGTGAAIVTIRKGGINEANVPLNPGERCTGDASAPDLAPGSTFPGCDPANLLSCPTTEACQIDCTNRSNVCAVAGSSGPGGSCADSIGCTAGSQCFDYSALGCAATQLCLRLCKSDGDCAAAGDGGIGPGSFCRNPVACGSVTTAYSTCSFSCDPTAAAATAAHTGCPAGLACVIPSSMDHVDCTCPEATRTGKENAPCSNTSQCAPGFLCEQTCRAVCRCDAQSGVCTAPNDCPTAGTTCTVVPNQTLYGVCLP